jgi:hypothetical protein
MAYIKDLLLLLRAHEQGLEVVVKLPLIQRYKAKEGRRAWEWQI